MSGRLLVVDASVLIKCYLPEIYSEECLRLLNRELPTKTCEYALNQIGASLWKRSRSGEVKVSDAKRILRSLARLPIEFVPTSVLAEAALELSSFSGRTFYEALYLVLALREETALITADHRWHALLATGKLKTYVDFVADVNIRLDREPLTV